MSAPVISLLLPTRARPQLVQRFLQSVVDTSTRLDRVEVILYVDDDDVGSHALTSDRVRVKRIIGPRMSMGEYNTRLLRESTGDIIVLANDDMVIRTPGWDEELARVDAEFPDRVYLAYANDLFKKRGLATFPILSRRTCELIGDPYPVEYRGAFIDVHIFDIFKRLEHAGLDRMRYLEHVVFEHLHFRAGKSEIDETYSKRGRFEDDPIFIGLVKARRDAATALIAAVRGGPASSAVRSSGLARQPTGLVSAIGHFTRELLFDSGLPLRWRTYLWYWFVGRYLAARGALRPFVK